MKNKNFIILIITLAILAVGLGILRWESVKKAKELKKIEEQRNVKEQATS
ncbi:MAG: hypothetical protein WAV31_04220 [Candidatus Moraniibacteriota bacterium]